VYTRYAHFSLSISNIICPIFLQIWAHGYQPPALAERVSYRGRVSAESSRGPSSSYSRSSAASTVTASNRSPASIKKDLEDALDKKVIPSPPLRNSNSPLPIRRRDVSVKSRKVRDVSVDSHASKSLRDPSSRVGLSGKVPYGQADKHRERSVSRSSRRDNRNVSASALEMKLDKSHSRGRSTSRTRSTSNGGQRSSSRHSRSVVDHDSSSARSCGPRNSSSQRRHSAEVTSSKSVCNMTFSRHDSAPQLSTSSLRTSGRYTRQTSNNESTLNKNSTRRMSSKQSIVTSETTESVTSSEEDRPVPRGRSTFSPNQRGRSKSRNDKSCERSLFSRLSRGRSKSKPRDEEETTIYSAGRSFANSLVRRRSLSRNASRVLKTTSSMDGNQDAEPCMQRFEVPFNPTTGACNYHPECKLAVRNGGVKGGWKIISDGCPRCL
jgi:hypothetical protein